MSKNSRHLFEGIGHIQVNNTLFPIHRNEVPQGANVTYSCIICDIQPQNKETHRVKLIVRGDKNNFDGPFSTPKSDLTTSKLHWNSIISTPDSRYLVVDINNFCLRNPMSKHEYYSIALSLIPQYIINKYNLMDNQINGFL